MAGCERIRRAVQAGVVAAVLVGAVLTEPVHADNAAPPVTLDRCDACHALDGEWREEWMPLVYGQPRSYVARMLAQFKAGTRPGKDMYREMAEYSDEELEVLAELVSRRAPVEHRQKTDLYLASVGQAIYEERCAYCHPDEGRGSEFDSAILAGQPLAYLRRQFEAIQTGRRPVLYMMQDNYIGLSQDDFEALSHFFASRPLKRRND